MAQHASGETRTLRQRFFDWCAEDSAAARFERSVAQGVIGVASGILAAYATQDPFIGTVVAPTVMAVLAPLQKVLGNRGEVNDNANG